MAGKLKAESGFARVLGEDARSTALNGRVALVSTETWGAQMPNLNVGDLVAAGVARAVGGGSTSTRTSSTRRAYDDDKARVESLKEALRLEPLLSHGTLALSDGERRRVQLFATLVPAGIEVVILDEALVELDLVVRAAFLGYLAAQNLAVLYATHVFDGLDAWATHAVTVQSHGQVRGVTALLGEASVTTTSLYARACAALDLVKEAHDDVPAAPTRWGAAAAAKTTSAAEEAIATHGLTWAYDARARPALRDLSLALPARCRAVVVGPNGAGKSTLLGLLGGARLAPNAGPDAIRALGEDPLKANARAALCKVALLGGAFKTALHRDVARVSADLPFSQLLASTLRDRVRVGDDAQRLTRRAAKLCALFGVEGSWRAARSSSGQKTRMQLVLQLASAARLCLVDELSRDLDVAGQLALLAWLRQDTEDHGTSIVYATHVYQGLDRWATHVVHLARGGVATLEALEEEEVGAGGLADGAIYAKAVAWLEADAAPPPPAPLGAARKATGGASSSASSEMPPPAPLPPGFGTRHNAMEAGYGSHAWTAQAAHGTHAQDHSSTTQSFDALYMPKYNKDFSINKPSS